MANPSSVSLRRALVATLRDEGEFVGERVERALLAVPRERFVPDALTTRGLEGVYRNEVIVIRRDERGTPTSSSSQPQIMVEMLEALDVRPGHSVLEIGAGSGYNAALLDRLVGRRGRVVSVEFQRDLVGAARAALGDGDASVEVVEGDGYDGWAAGAPYDRIIVTASVDSPPRAWHEQLRPGGRLVVPMRFGSGVRERQCVIAFDRTEVGFQSSRLLPGGFMALRRGGEPASTSLLPGHLAVNDRSTGGSAAALFVAGERLDRLTPNARHRLLVTLLSRPRRRALRGDRGLVAYLGLALADRERVSFSSSHAPRGGGVSGVGLVAPGGHGVGLVAPGGSGATFVVSRRDRPSMLSFGEATSTEEEILRLLPRDPESVHRAVSISFATSGGRAHPASPSPEAPLVVVAGSR